MVNARRPRAASLSYLETLPTLVPPIFDQAQHTTANHRKNIVSLRKIQETCASVVEETPKGTKLVGEKAFNIFFVGMLNRVMPIKKGVAVGDRIVKFVAAYVAYTTEQDLASRPEGEEDVDSPYSRFVVKILRHLLAGMEAKDKNVRYRVILLTVSMISGLGELDDEVYVQLRKCLVDRSRDKEVPIRVQAALGLSKLQNGEDEGDLEEGQEPLSQVLLDLLRYDPAAEVRRAALLSFPCTPATINHLLARARDVDAVLRRTVYVNSLSAAALPDARILTIAQREEAVRNGLGDREGGVRKAAAAMLGGWLDQAEGDLVEFLGRFDVVTSQVAEEALLSVFVTRPEVLDAVEFGDEFWSSLTLEKAFLARVFVDHCISAKEEARLEDTIPVVTALAFRIQDEYNNLVTSTNDEAEDIQERAFMVGELLKLAVNLDYVDEIGRRKMFQLAREMVSQANLPEALIPRCLDILSKTSDGERDLMRVVVDVVTELREGEGDEDVDMVAPSEASALGSPVRRKSTTPRFDLQDPEQRIKAALVDMRCLLVCISLLERVNSNLQDNSVFHGLLPDLIIPAVRNKEEPALRDQGLVCLGLCCMIDTKMAANSFGLFVQQLQAADDELKVKIVQILFDLLMVQDIQTLLEKTMAADQLVELVRLALRQEAPEVQAVACEGVAKLMLAGMIQDETILQSLVLLYFSPETADNQALRQCLTYFIPVYCYSAPSNQRRMLSIFSSNFELLAQLHDDSDDSEMLPLAQMGMMMVDWLDPLKAVEREGVRSEMGIHLELGVEIMKAILTETTKETRKSLVSFLSKLNLPEAADSTDLPVKSIEVLNSAIQSRRRLADATSRNALNKFVVSCSKRYASILEEFDEEAFRSDDREEVKALFDLIDDVDEMDLEAQSEVPSRKNSRRATSASTRATSETPSLATSIAAGSDDESVAGGVDLDLTPRKTPARKAKGLKRVVEEEEEEEEGEESGEEEEEEEEEEEDDEDVESMLDEDEVI